ncbi:beta-ketoacyl-[acyl-carrier-protein] synthase family protein [Desulfurivibrio dismutans]|uniref:beta-ketoacyl-[acyl-carrier-protein] synthase family protein n=1 Tax=Desulfurivibrio dismutans TaxID=1398908 RepID=UPI0023DAFDCD|nr:beta-ketoacyl-[acyl-carrier-protein] synthase family protein [Desulfurivibrio alkaliphilus]MDF1614729.1 beta-ketoacyl-[acyl-carrier-protein] synthase family protein [Desulfurivibrio alkaliphilus]
MGDSAAAVAVSGLGCLSAAGLNLDEHRNALAGGEVNCGPVPAEIYATSLPFPVFSVAGDIRAVVGGLSTDEATMTAVAGLSRTGRLALAAALEAIARAGLDPASLRGRKVGVCLGTTVGCAFNDEDYYRAWRQGRRPPLAPLQRYLQGNISTALQAILQLAGPALVITNACASGTDAIGVAADWLRRGRCELAIAGGADALSRIAGNGFTSLLLTDADPCRPFDESRQGLNLGEGAGVLLLERRESATREGRRPQGWIRGFGTAGDAWHPTAPHPEGIGMQRAIAAALQGSSLQRRDISLINGHGTGTPANDLAETTAVAAVFGENGQVPLVSTKALTGHTLGAAGAIEAIFTLLALQAGKTVGSRRCRRPDPAFHYCPLAEDEERVLAGPIGLSQSLAFGGGNSGLILEAAS